MNTSKVLLILLGFQCALVLSETDDVVPRIVRGYNCDIANYPFLVLVISSTICGGTIITLDWVLTAGHCVKEKAVNTFIVAGRNYPYVPNENSTEQLRTAIRVKIHKKFDESEIFEYDIAVLKMNYSFTFTASVKPALLPYKGFTKHCQHPKIMGWGHTNEHAEVTDTWTKYELPKKRLKCADVAIGSDEECSKYKTHGKRHLCIVHTGATNTGSACLGDSGGPLVCDNPIYCKNNHTPNVIVVGVAQSVATCQVKTPNFYIDLEKYMRWLKDDAEIVFPRGTGPGGTGMKGFVDFNSDSASKAVRDEILIGYLVLGNLFRLVA